MHGVWRIRPRRHAPGTHGKSPSKMELYSWKDHPTIYCWISMTWFILIPRRVVLYSKALQVGGFDPKLTPRGLENGMLASFNDSCPKVIQNPLFGKVKSTLLHFFPFSDVFRWFNPPLMVNSSKFFFRAPPATAFRRLVSDPQQMRPGAAASILFKGW